MKYLMILGNGMVWPAIKKNDSIIAVINGVVRVGKYNKTNYLGGKFYLDCPCNEEEIMGEIVEYIKIRIENLFKIEDICVHFFCPKEISSKFIWALKSKELVKVI